MLQTYGFLGLFRLGVDYIKTKLFTPQCRIIRRPVYIRGDKFISWGRGLTSGVNLRIDVFNVDGHPTPRLQIGDNCQINDYVHIGVINSVIIGNNVLIASKVFISDHNHGDFENDPEMNISPAQRKLTATPTKICDNAWLGEGVMVLPGVTIGKHSIIGAGAIVTKDIPEYSIAVGNPARVTKQYNKMMNKWVKI